MQAITRNRMSGLSLVELMVALGISVLLLMGVVALFVSSRASYETTERLSRIQENGRFALEQLASDIRANSFQACARAMGTTQSRARDYKINATTLPFPPPLDEDEEGGEEVPVDMRWDFANPMLGFNGTGEEWVPEIVATSLENFDPLPSPLGDVLVLRMPRREVRAVTTSADQETPMGSDPLQINVINPMPIKSGDTVMISDCEARAFFQVTNDPTTGQIAHAQTGPTSADGVARPGNVSGDLLHPFKVGSTIVPISSVIYYLAPSRNQPEPRPGEEDQPERLSLYRKTGGGATSDEVAEGIERFEIQYGIDSEDALDGRVDTYVAAEDVEDWNLVMTVQIALLSRAPDEYGTDIDRQTYTLLTAPELVQAGPFNDRAQRKVFTATLGVRNQIID